MIIGVPVYLSCARYQHLVFLFHPVVNGGNGKNLIFIMRANKLGAGENDLLVNRLL